jgi:hypothetical protein
MKLNDGISAKQSVICCGVAQARISASKNERTPLSDAFRDLIHQVVTLQLITRAS